MSGRAGSIARSSCRSNRKIFHICNISTTKVRRFIRAAIDLFFSTNAADFCGSAEFRLALFMPGLNRVEMLPPTGLSVDARVSAHVWDSALDRLLHYETNSLRGPGKWVLTRRQSLQWHYNVTVISICSVERRWTAFNSTVDAHWIALKGSTPFNGFQHCCQRIAGARPKIQSVCFGVRRPPSNERLVSTSVSA